MGHSNHHHGRPSKGREAGPLIEIHDELTDATMERRLWIAIVGCAVVTVIGLVMLWPREELTTTIDSSSLFGDRVEATVLSNNVEPCTYDPIAGCYQVTLRILGGSNPNTDFSWELPFGNGNSQYEQGDDVYVYETALPDDGVSYAFADFQRETPLILLGMIFVIAVILLARWKGVGAIGGLVASLLVLVVFMLPSLLRGHNAVAVALVGSSLIAFVALYLAHGINIATTVALLSTFASLVVIGALSYIFVVSANFTGFTEDSSYILALGVSIDARGLLLAGIVIGSLGVLDDVTVTQVSAVWELRQLQPNATRQEIYRSAVNIGRDHISSTVNTLFLTYAGAALPLLLLFNVTGQSISTVSTSEVVATEIVRALVGSIGLVASVPISTWMATRVLGAGPAITPSTV